MAKARSFPFEGTLWVTGRGIYQQLLESGKNSGVGFLDGGLARSRSADASIRKQLSKLSSPVGNRMHAHPCDQSDLPVTAITQFFRFQACVQPPLSLIKGTERLSGKKSLYSSSLLLWILKR